MSTPQKPEVPTAGNDKSPAATNPSTSAAGTPEGRSTSPSAPCGGVTIPLMSLFMIILSIGGLSVFVASFAPILIKSIDAALTTASDFGDTVQSGIRLAVEENSRLSARTFDSLDSAGIQDYYHFDNPKFSIYWLLRARNVGPFPIWLGYYEGSGVYVGERVPFNYSIPATPNESVVWVTTHFGNNNSYTAEMWQMAFINTSVIPGTRIGPFTTQYNASTTAWYQYLVQSIFAHWDIPRVNTVGSDTSMFVGAQGGVDPLAYYCTYAAEVSSYATTKALMALEFPHDPHVILFHASTLAVVGTNIPWVSVVNDSGVLRPTELREMGLYSNRMNRVLSESVSLLTTCATPCEIHVGSGHDALFVHVEAIRDVYGQNLRFCAVLEVSSFTAAMDAATKVAIGIAIPVVVVVTAVLVLTMWFTAKPIQELEVAMTDGKLGEADLGEHSWIAEIAGIQNAYTKLQEELKKVKSFLPQAVLMQLEGGDSGNDEGDIGSQGTLDRSGTPVENSGDSTPVRTMSASGPAGSSLSRHPSGSQLQGASAVSAGAGGGGGGSGGKGRRKKMENMALVSKRVTVVVINILGTHAHVKRSGVNAMVRAHTAWMSTIQDSVAKARGVLEAFSGDRFTVSFNASSNCAAHYTAAAGLMQVLEERLASEGGGFLGLAMGSSSGPAHCGHLGTDSIKGFAIVGQVMTVAFALMRRAAALQLSNLVCAEAAAGMAYQFIVVPADLVLLPQQATSDAVVISTVLHKKETANDEWMYELQEAETNFSLNKLMEEAFEAYLDGNRVLVQAKIAKVLDEAPDYDPAKLLLSHVDTPSKEYARVIT